MDGGRITRKTMVMCRGTMLNRLILGISKKFAFADKFLETTDFELESTNQSLTIKGKATLTTTLENNQLGTDLTTIIALGQKITKIPLQIFQ
jgi:hypothetical protein